MDIRLALVCLPLFVVSLLVVISIYRAHGDKPVHRWFLVLGIMILLWQVSCILEFLVRDETTLRYVYNFTISFAAFVSLSFLLLTLNFYGLGDFLSRGIVGLMLVLPAVTFLLALFGDPFLLLTQELEIVAVYPLYEVYWRPGMWFWAHCAYTVLVLSMGLYHALTQHIRLPRSFRECSSLMVGGQIVVSGTVALALLAPRGPALLLDVVGTCCALVPLYIAMKNNDRMNYLYMARTHILDQLDTSIFILDKEHNLLEVNRAGQESLQMWTGKQETSSLVGVLQQLQEMGAVFEDAVEGETGVDVSIHTDTVSRIYNVHEEILPDRKGNTLGSFVTCTDVTRNRRLIRWLEHTSGTDALTGLPNRSSLGLRRAAYEANDVLPLSVIAGDVDGLKQVNDTLGHQYGDQLLIEVGQVLMNSSPPESTAFRIGGDEFVIILPNTGPEGAARVEATVQKALEHVDVCSFRPSIALGSATRTSQSVSLEEVIHQADQVMYQVKKKRRARGDYNPLQRRDAQ